jgi:hypothetical protein
VNWPRSYGIDFGYKDPLAAAASVLATCFKNQFHFSIVSVQKDVESAASVRPRSLRTHLNRLFGLVRGDPAVVTEIDLLSVGLYR